MQDMHVIRAKDRHPSDRTDAPGGSGWGGPRGPMIGRAMVKLQL